MAVRVLIVDDHAPFRALARMLLVADGFDVVGEAGDGAAGPRRGPRPAPGRRAARRAAARRRRVRRRRGARCGAGRPRRRAGVEPVAAADYGLRVAESVARGFIAKAELSGAALRLVLGEE